uniref:Uncharacterized protein n=1 Tax=Oryza brachyantha TaxID=4533 RepID=J3L8V3_ORYBR
MTDMNRAVLGTCPCSIMPSSAVFASAGPFFFRKLSTSSACDSGSVPTPRRVIMARISCAASGTPSFACPRIRLLKAALSSMPFFISCLKKVSALLVFPLLHKYSITGL